MNYKKIYFSIIENRKLNPLLGYTEEHHILPRCLGGDDTANNLVRLSPREHYICHLLLTKMYPIGPSHYKMVKAICMMSLKSGCMDRIVMSNRTYEKLRISYSKAMSLLQSGKKNSQFSTMWITDGVDSKKISVESPIPPGWTKGRKVPSLKGVQKSKEHKEKISNGMKKFKGVL